MCWTLTRQAVVYANIVANNKIVVNKKNLIFVEQIRILLIGSNCMYYHIHFRRLAHAIGLKKY